MGGSSIGLDMLGRQNPPRDASNSNNNVMSPNSTNSLNRTQRTNKEDKKKVVPSPKNKQVLIQNSNPRNSVESAINEDDIDL